MKAFLHNYVYYYFGFLLFCREDNLASMDRDIHNHFQKLHELVSNNEILARENFTSLKEKQAQQLSSNLVRIPYRFSLMNYFFIQFYSANYYCLENNKRCV
jgi:hypothetical protein